MLACVMFAQMNQTVFAQNLSSHTYIPGEESTLRVEINRGQENLKEVRLRFRSAGTLEYMVEPMKQSAPGSIWYEGSIPSKYLDNSEIQYYFEFILNNLVVEVLPWEFDAVGPFTLVSGAMKGRVESGFVLLSTDEDFAQKDEFVLAVSFMSIAEDIDPSSIQVWIGGKNVTSKATITENAIVYRDDRPSAGLTKAVVTADMKGEKVQSPTWITDVKGKPRLQTSLHGNWNFATNVYDYNYKTPPTGNVYEAGDDWSTWGDIYGTAGKSTLFTNIYYSSLEDANKQRVNRYTLGLKMPHLDIIAGDYSPMISSFTMNNRNVYGLYGKLYAKYLGIEATAGEMVRKTTQDDLFDDNNNLISIATGTFRQEAMAARLRLGLEDGFMIGVNATRNRDIISSLDAAYYSWDDDPDPTVEDIKYTVTPKDNLVLSVDARLNIPEQNVMLGVEVAGSILNNNTLGGPISTDDIAEYAPEIDFIDTEALADIFIVNRNMQPLLPSLQNMAWMAYFRTYFWNSLLNVNYSVTGPAFNALSTYYQQNDTQVISLTDQTHIGRFLTLSGGYSVTLDNYSKTYAETNRSDAWYVQGMVRLPLLPYLKASYFNTDTKNENNPTVQTAADFTPYLKNARNLSFGIGYYWHKLPILPSQFDITYRIAADNNKTGVNEDLQYENFTNSLNISMVNNFAIIPLRTQFVFSTSNQERNLDLDPSNLTLEALKDDNFTFFSRAEVNLFNKALIPYVQYRLVNLTGDTADESYQYITAGVESYPLRGFSIMTDISQKYYTNQLISAQDNDSLTWRLLLTQRF